MMPISPQAAPAVDLSRLLRSGAVLLDVRTEQEFAGFHLEGAVNIPFDNLDDNLETVRQWKRPVIVYSADDQRSYLAATRLRNNGITTYTAGPRDRIIKHSS